MARSAAIIAIGDVSAQMRVIADSNNTFELFWMLSADEKTKPDVVIEYPKPRDNSRKSTNPK